MIANLDLNKVNDTLPAYTTERVASLIVVVFHDFLYLDVHDLKLSILTTIDDPHYL